MPKALTESERFLLATATDWLTCRCPVHGIVQAPRSVVVPGTQPVEPIADPAAYLNAH